MARPKLGESESKRLQMVITEDEVDAIDEWQHQNRIASRSEAIRRLIQLGIIFERKFPQLLEETLDASKKANELLGPEDSTMTSVSDLRKSNTILFDFNISIMNSILTLIAESNIIRLPEFDDSLSLQKHIREKFKDLGPDSPEAQDYLKYISKRMVEAYRAKRANK